MAHYDAREIVENIERVLDEKQAREDGLSEEAQRSLFRSRRMEERRRSILQKIEHGPLVRMREFQAIDRVPEGARFRFLKKVFARLLRIISAPQAAYNFENIEALQAVAREVDILRERLHLVEDGPARPFGLAHHEGSEETRLSSLVQQHIQLVQQNLDNVSKNVVEITQSITRMVDNMSSIAGRVNTLNVRQRDVYTEISAARLDVSRIWTELGLVYESIDQRAEDLWKGLDERDVQLLMNTEAAQQLHGQVSSLGVNTKELRARLLALSEQLAIQQEMLESLGEEVKTEPAPAIRPRPIRESATERPATDAPKAATPRAKEEGSPAAEEASPLIQRQLDLAYLRFQRQFRGDEEELRARQRDYIDILARSLKGSVAEGDKPTVLDVACGDGIFIELLHQAGWNARGVDLSEMMVKTGTGRGLNIEHADALEFLERTEQRSLDIITCFQFVEHLPPAALMKYLRLAYRALKPQGLVLVETINPHTLKALHWFHFDLTHQRLIFPEMLQVLAETAGFLTVEWKGVNAVSPLNALKPTGDETERKNIEKLNETLFGEQDYYFLGRKPGGTTG